MLAAQPRCLMVGCRVRVKNLMMSQPPRCMLNLPLKGVLSLSKSNSRSNGYGSGGNNSSRCISSIITVSVSHNNNSSYNNNSKSSSNCNSKNNNSNIISYSNSSSSISRRSNNSISVTSGYCRTFSRTFSDGFQSKGILGKLARLFDTSNNAANVAGAKALINIGTVPNLLYKYMYKLKFYSTITLYYYYHYLHHHLGWN